MKNQYNFLYLIVFTFKAHFIFAADFYTCDGVIQDRPCEQSEHDSWSRKDKDQKKSKAEDNRTEATKEEESDQAPPTATESERPKPEVDAKSQKLDTLEWEFYGTVKGQGTVELTLNYLINNGTKKFSKKFAASRRVKLGTKETKEESFSIRARPPVNSIWRWEVIAVNK